MTGGAAGEQIRSLALDPIIHIAPGAIDLVGQVLVCLGWIGLHKSGVYLMQTVLGFDDNPNSSVPNPSPLVDRGKYSQLVSGRLKKFFYQVYPRSRPGFLSNIS